MRNIHPVWQAVERHAPDLCGLADRVWGTPETLYAEFRSCAEHTAMLRQKGFRVTESVAGLPTAMRKVADVALDQRAPPDGPPMSVDQVVQDDRFESRLCHRLRRVTSDVPRASDDQNRHDEPTSSFMRLSDLSQGAGTPRHAISDGGASPSLAAFGIGADTRLVVRCGTKAGASATPTGCEISGFPSHNRNLPEVFIIFAQPDAGPC